ncbi:hypothetical protein DYB36_004273, partial [Aphanomyces astaci]
MRAIISGAGVAGTILANALTHLGAQVDIIDSHANSVAGGYAFLLLDNGVQGLKLLGLWDSVTPLCIQIHTVRYFDADGSHLSDCALQESYIVSRLPFIRAMRHQQTVVQAKLTFDGDRMILPDDDITYDVVAGCEGARSPTRAWMNSGLSIFSVGSYELLGLLSPTESTVLRPHLAPGHMHKFLSSESATAIASQMQFKVYVWHASAISNVETLYKQNVVLFGDAAHQFHPFSSQGVNGAIDDIVEFVQLLQAHDNDVATVGPIYSQRRLDATKPVVAEGLVFASKFKSFPSNTWMHVQAPIIESPPSTQLMEPLRMAPLEVLRERAFNYRWATVPKGVIPLTAADPDFACSDRVVEFLQNKVATKVFPYAPAMGLDEFRQAIAGHFSHHRVVSPDQVLAANSAASVVMNYLVGPNDAILIPDPVDFLIPLTAQRTNARVIRFPVTRSGLDLAVLEAYYDPSVKFLAICNPHNPLGFVYSAHDLHALVGWASARSFTLISDEVWADTVADKASFHSMLTFYPNTWTVYGLSKGFALAGFRIGAILAPSAAEARALADHGGFVSTVEGVSSLSQMAAVGALRHGLAWNQAFVTHCQTAMAFVAQALTRTGCFDAVAPQGTFLVWAKMTAALPLSAEDVVRRLAVEALVSVVPGWR